MPDTPSVDTPTTPDTPTSPDVPTVDTPSATDLPSVDAPTLAMTDVPTMTLSMLGHEVDPTAVNLNPLTLASSVIAPIATGNPPADQYTAALPSSDLPINGESVVSSVPNGSCAVITNNFNSLPATGGPFSLSLLHNLYGAFADFRSVFHRHKAGSAQR